MAALPKEVAAILQAEQRQGYLDSSVLGGFGEWLASLARQEVYSEVAGQLLALAAAYTEAALNQRPQIWQQAQALLQTAAEKIALDDAASQKKPAKSSIQAADCLQTSIEYLKGVGPKRAVLLRRLGIYKMADLLFNRPRSYESRPQPVTIAELPEGEPAVVCGRVLNKTVLRPKRGLTILKVLLSDGTGNIAAVWYNQQHLEPKLLPGVRLALFGKVERRYGGLELAVQDYELIELAEQHGFTESGLLPVYALTANLNQKAMRRLMATAWDKYAQYLQDGLPPRLLAEHNLLPLQQALAYLHFPENEQQVEQGRQRLAYEELLVTQLTVLANRLPEQEQMVQRPPTPEMLPLFCEVLPYHLTGAQRRVIEEILADMQQPRLMRRLVQGDVGSGKTVVAAAALYQNYLMGRQGSLMAPTEILAEQHYQNLGPLLQKLGLRVALLTGDTPAVERRELLAELAAGNVDVLVGTHALFSADVEFAQLGLAITDEQHRFGVNQRNMLRQKGALADVLVLTATPIPRTLAMTFCGDLAVSVIDELPPGRQPIATYAVSYDLEPRALGFVRAEVEKGRQAYIVCPLVEESEALELESAIQVLERLQSRDFADFKLGLLHGKMKPQEKSEVMQAFAEGEIQILVATTVIEVGVDVPNATVMMIRDSERFGLAQLHQLRGRVGRGGEQSYCILLNNAKSREARERIKTLTESSDGFMIAEADLRLRGAGELLGTRQSGLAMLKFADLARDMRLVEAARADAQQLLASGEYLQWPLAEEVRRKSELLES